MRKKRILSVVLFLMITLCCVVEALLIKGLREDRTDMQKQMESFESRLEHTTTELNGIQTNVEELQESGIPEVFLPDDIYVAAGLTVEIYNDTIIRGVNLDNYSIFWKCDVGDCMNEKYRLRALQERIGEYAIRVTVYDFDMNEIAYKDATLHIVENSFADANISKVDMMTIEIGRAHV